MSPKGPEPRPASGEPGPTAPINRGIWRLGRGPEWMRSIRFRYTMLYSALLFGLAALMLGVLYLVVLIALRSSPVSGSGGPYCFPSGRCYEYFTMQEFENRVNTHTLLLLRHYTFAGLAVLFLTSLAVGWWVAGQVLAPIGRITTVARAIQATDLSRRIRLQGPDDELKQLADTFDAMLARLAAAFDAQRQFVADASHELRNPLAIIRTNVDLALADPDPDVEELRQTIIVIKRASDRMARLVDDLLALARRQAPNVENEPVDLATVVVEASDEFVAPAEARGITLERDIAGDLTVTGDPDAFKRAVANLLENAVRLAPAGSRIRVATGREGGWAWVSVADQGPGILPEDQPRVFDRFWRADRGRARRDGGTGLGLAIVRQIVESHGGQVRLHSNPGDGSTFVLWLPLAPTTGQPVPRETPATVR
jgi:heavy metal sensor kinase